MIFQIRYWSSAPADLSVEVAEVEHDDIDQLAAGLVKQHGLDVKYPNGKSKKVMLGAILSIEEK